MTVQFALNVFGWRISTFDIRLDIDHTTTPQPFVDRGVKTLSRWWTKRMAS